MPVLVICRGCHQPHRTSPCDNCRRTDNQRRNNTPQHKARTSIPKAQRQRIYRRDHHQCTYCGTTTDLTLDHVRPLIHNPGHVYTDSELVTACRSCNSSKGALPLPQHAT